MAEDKAPVVIMTVWSDFDEEVWLEVDIRDALEQLTSESWDTLFEFEWQDWQTREFAELYKDTKCKELFDWIAANHPDNPKFEFGIKIEWRDALKWLLWHRDRSLKSQQED